LLIVTKIVFEQERVLFDRRIYESVPSFLTVWICFAGCRSPEISSIRVPSRRKENTNWRGSYRSPTVTSWTLNVRVAMPSKQFSHTLRGQWNAMDAVRYFARRPAGKQD